MTDSVVLRRGDRGAAVLDLRARLGLRGSAGDIFDDRLETERYLETLDDAPATVE